MLNSLRLLICLDICIVAESDEIKFPAEEEEEEQES